MPLRRSLSRSDPRRVSATSLFIPLMSELVTGAAYVEAITSLDSDRRARAAFRDLVLRIARPGAAVFDFGAGPGLDARFYAERGFAVAAYDIDPNMCEFFSTYCREFIETGQVVLYQSSYRQFLARNELAERRVDLITSNFAPLSYIADLRELFAKFHALTRPNGQVLACVINPYWIRDLKCRWWWRNTLRLWREGYYVMPGPLPTFRRRLANYNTDCAPYFVLERVFPGMPTEGAPAIDGVNVSRGIGHAWLRLTSCQFIFLLFRKQDNLT